MSRPDNSKQLIRYNVRVTLEWLFIARPISASTDVDRFRVGSAALRFPMLHSLLGNRTASQEFSLSCGAGDRHT